MKTSYYTFTTWSEGAMAAGFDAAAVETRQSRMVREPERKNRGVGGDNVIELAAWRAANELEQPQEEPEWEDLDWAGEQPEEPELVCGERVRRARRNHSAAFAAELLSTLSVAAAAAMLVARVALF